jgi:hypothetical protein
LILAIVPVITKRVLLPLKVNPLAAVRPVVVFNTNVVPVGNSQRGFFQLTKFNSVKQSLSPKTYFELKENVLLTKYLIEWVVNNPENNQDKFGGSVYLYQLKFIKTTLVNL